VFLALAALYESWSIPLAVILVVPLGVLGVLLGAHAARPVQRRVFQCRA
jgi:multidrug efflux pump